VSTDTAVVERVQRLFVEALNIQVPSPETDLIESGMIDSLTLVELLFAIEREFSVTIPFDELEIETFRSVNRIGELVAAADRQAAA
jgi:methoxymalonate biosynthesis acyl carrier protein